MAETGRELADLAAELVTYPQVLLNVRVREKKDLQAVPAIADSMRRVEERLAGNGRLLVRYSGTEPLLRVMIEGQGSARDPGLGGGDRQHRQGTPRMTRRSLARAAERQRQQGRDASQLARRHVPSVVEATRVCRRRRRAGHHRSSARRRPPHHASPTCARSPSELRARCEGRVELNIEGDPRPDLLALAAGGPARSVHAGAGARRRDHQPGRLGSATPTRRRCAKSSRSLSGGGHPRQRLRRSGSRPPSAGPPSAGGDRIELYTEPFARAFHAGPGQ